MLIYCVTLVLITVLFVHLCNRNIKLYSVDFFIETCFGFNLSPVCAIEASRVSEYDQEIP